MKKVFIIIVQCSLLIIDCFGQSITWQRTYQGIDRQDHGYEVLIAPNNNFYFVGSSFIPDYSYILKINQYGDTIWSKAFGMSRAYCATNSPDSGCVFTGSRFTTKLDRDGNVIWQKDFNSGATVWEIKRVFDGGYIACGNAGLSAYVLKIDSLGSLQWQQYYAGGSVKGYYSIEESIGNGYVLTGGLDLRPMIDSSKIIVTKIDYSGNILWEKTYGADRYSHGIKVKKTDYGFIIGGNSIFGANYNRTFILKVDQNGNKISLNIFQTTPNYYYEFFDDIEFVNNNRFIITLNRDSINTFVYSKVLITDSSLNTIHDKLFESYSFSSFKSILPLTNGDILFGGTFDYYTNWLSHRFDFYAVRTDSNLNSTSFPPIGIINNSNEYEGPRTFDLYQNYPNPFNPSTSIQYSIPKTGYVKLVVFDISGREIAVLVNGQVTAGTHEVRWDAANMSSGIYFYRITSGDFTDTRKMILLK